MGWDKSASQLFRYGQVGVLANLAAYLVYLLITQLGGQPVLTMTCLYITSVLIGFAGNRKWTFGHKGNVYKAGIKYFAAHVVGYFINLSLLIVLVDKLGYSHQWVQALAIIFVAGFLFVTFKFIVFNENISMRNNR